MEATIEIIFKPRNKEIDLTRLFEVNLRKGLDMEKVINEEILEWVKINYINTWDLKA